MPGLGRGENREWQLRAWGFLIGGERDDENVTELYVVIFAEHCDYTENHWIIQLNWWIVWYINYISIKLF